MYEAVRARPEGRATVARHAVTAREYGYDGIVVRNGGDRYPEYDAGRIGAETGVDVVEGIEVRAESRDRASGYVGNYRPDYEVVVVRGGSPAMNRFAVEQDAVDVLARPMAGDGDFDAVLARAARDHGVRVEVALDRVLRSQGGTRVRNLQDLRKLRELIEAYEVPFVVTAGAASHLGLRAPRELCAIGEVVGFGADAIERGLAEWRRLAERNRERLSESFVEPGVREGRYDRDGSTASDPGGGSP